MALLNLSSNVFHQSWKILNYVSALRFFNLLSLYFILDINSDLSFSSQILSSGLSNLPATKAIN